MADKDSFRETLAELVDTYSKHEDAYQSNKDYNEFSLREEFLDPFFEALGWDIRNAGREPPHRRDVRFERPNDKRKKPDYLFLTRQGPRLIPRLVVEAKAPSASLDAVGTINQAKSYAWNNPDVDVAILTNFGEFKVYDGSIRPDPRHPERGLLREPIQFSDYTSEVDYLWNFSKQAVEAGSLARLLPSGAKERQYRVPVDEAFLEDMTGWRETLAKDLYSRNPEVTAELLNDVVQRTLDRLVFIRMAEDRGILSEGGLLAIIQTWKLQRPDRPIQGAINHLYSKVHRDLNGEIFEAHACEDERYWFTPSVLAKIIESLYFPNSPYLFDVIGVELLGSIYERFLGKKIRLTEKRVKVEEKPEVKKAGGVVYTPSPIVDYIVEVAVGDQISGQNPALISNFKVLDPACGSGSFLVSAFSRIAEEYLRYYESHPGSAGRGTLFPDLIVEGETSRLSIEKKSEILRNCVFGVDIDPQAVEVTMLSLYLKVLEGEEAIPENKGLLPRMKQNIRCGNSLVGRADLPQTTLDGEILQPTLKPFDWDDQREGFGSVLATGKFDAVIGNPPYVRIQQLKKWSPREAEFVQGHYSTARKGNVDLYIPFIQKAVELVRHEGVVGVIVQHKFFQANYGASLRNVIANGRLLRQIVNFGHQQLFKGRTTYPCLLFLSPQGSRTLDYAEFSKVTDLREQLGSLREVPRKQVEGVASGIIEQIPAGDTAWIFSPAGAGDPLFQRLSKKWPPLRRVARIFRGGQTSADNVFILELVSPSQAMHLDDSTVRVRVEGDGEPFALETRFLKPLFKSGEFNRYNLESAKRVLVFPYSIEGDKASLLDFNTIRSQAPRTAGYLESRRKDLHGRKGAKKWWAYGYPKNLTEFDAPKIVTRDLAPRAEYCLDKVGGAYFPGGAAGGYGIRPDAGIDVRYLLGLLNSRLLDRLLQRRTTRMRDGWFDYEYRFIKDLPVRPVSPEDREARRLHDEIVERVERLLSAYPKWFPLPPSSVKDSLEREIRTLEREVDERVESLYGLTAEERKSLR